MPGVHEVLPPRLGARISGLFGDDVMGVAGRACERLGNPPGLFLALCPTDVLRGCLVRLYASHVEELVERHKRNEDLTLGTKAEVLAGLMRSSLKAPLRPEALALYEQLFAACTALRVASPLGRELYPGQTGEMLADARKALRNPARLIREG